MELLTFPNSSLTTPTIPVTYVDYAIENTVKELLAFIVANPNAEGIAANQLGLNPSIFASRTTIYVNPEIVWGKFPVIATEGCLSFPELYINRPRFSYLFVKYALYPSLRVVKHKVRGLEAQVFQHECEHLAGRTFLDDLEESTRDAIMGRYTKTIQHH